MNDPASGPVGARHSSPPLKRGAERENAHRRRPDAEAPQTPKWSIQIVKELAASISSTPRPQSVGSATIRSHTYTNVKARIGHATHANPFSSTKAVALNVGADTGNEGRSLRHAAVGRACHATVMFLSPDRRRELLAAINFENLLQVSDFLGPVLGMKLD
jgi:hypothetical protein